MLYYCSLGLDMATRQEGSTLGTTAAPSFRVVLAPGRGKPALTLPATDAASALILAQRHGKGRKAELWRGDKLVCRIAEDQFAGFWGIG